MQLYAEPGGEIYIPFAKKKLALWKAEAARAGVAVIHKRVDVSDGSTIYVDSTALGHGMYNDRIRITGNTGPTWVSADPVQSLWGTYSAILPATRPGAVLPLEWAPIVQHVSSTYLSRPRTVVRTVDGTAYQVTVDQEKTISHTLAVCRYCRRVAEYKWDEVWVFDPEYVPVGQPSGAGYTITSQYVSPNLDLEEDNSTTVTLVDVAADGTQSNQRVITHGLLAAALANPWGWAGETAPAAPTPVVIPAGQDSTSPGVVADSQVFLGEVVSLVQGIADLLETKLLTDATELAPHPSIPHEDQQAVYVFPVRSTVTAMAISTEGTFFSAPPSYGNLTFTLTASHKVMGALVNVLGPPATSGTPHYDVLIYGVGIGLPTPSPLVPYYRATTQPVVKYAFDSASKTFSLVPPPVDTYGADVPWLIYTKAYYSSGVDVTHLEMTGSAAPSWGAIYKVTASSAATAQYALLLGLNQVGSTFRSTFCVGAPTFDDVSYACYSAVFTKRGASQRQVDQTYTTRVDGTSIIVTQSAIPNEDTP